MARTFAALREPNYRLYFSGALVSNIGTWMQRVAQDWLVLELSGGSAFAVGLTTALQFLPALLLAPYAGLAADRFAKRQLLRVTQWSMAVLALVLGVLAITEVAHTWHVYLIALLFGVVAALDMPARQAFVSEMVGTQLVPNAIGLNSASFNIGRLIGPALGGLVIAAWGSGWAILTNAITYLSMLLALWLLDPERLHPSVPVRRKPGQVRAGFAYVRSRPDLLMIFGVAFCVGTFSMNFQMTNALMAAQEFHKSAQEYGILGSVMAVGSLSGALLAARRSAATRVRVIVLLGMGFGLYNIVLGFVPTYWAYFGMLPVAGLLAISVLTACNATVQLGTEPTMRGRALALYSMVLMGGTPVGSTMLGALAEAWGPRWVLWGGGVFTVIGIIIVLLVVTRISHLSVETRRHPWRVDVYRQRRSG